MLNIERIDSLDRFLSLQPEWNSLLDRSEAKCVFLTHEWLSTWWKHLAEGRKLHIVTVRDENRLIGILPTALRSVQLARMMPRMLEFLGSGVIGSDYLDLIVDPDRESEVLDAVAHQLIARGTVLQFGQLRRGHSVAERLAAKLGRRNWSASGMKINVCPYISLKGHTWQTYLATLGSSQRYNFQRRLRNLEKVEGFRFETKTSLDTLIDLHRKRWQDRPGMSEAFQNDEIVAFHREFEALASRNGWARMLSIWIKDQPAAGIYGLRYGDTFYFYQSGFDAAFSRQSVGLVMMGMAIRSAIEEGATEYDLLHGDEEYKFHWTQETRELGRLELYPPHARGVLYKRCADLNRAARKVARQVLSRA